MMSPRSRLLFWVAVIVPPFGLLAVAAPAATAVSLLLIGGLFLLALADAAASFNRLDGIAVEGPAIARMSKDREAKLELRIRNARRPQRLLRVALGLPREIRAVTAELDVRLPPEVEYSRLSWACMPVRRGCYQLRSAYVEGSSPLGFWAIRREVPMRSEIRVYPNLLEERKSLAALFLNRGGFGLHAQRQVGKGRDFERLREYSAGDSFDEIHWKATAKHGRPITKVFQIERTQEVYVVVDASRLSARTPERAGPTGPGPSEPATLLERFVTAALVLGLAAERQGDLFGLLTFADQVETFVRARNGKTHFHACRDALYRLQPRVVTPDFDEVCAFIRLTLRRRALVVFLTSLDDPALADSFVRNLDLIRRQHLIIVNMMRSPAVAPLFSGPELASADDLYPRLGGHLRWRQLRELEQVLRRRGVGFSLLENERLSAGLVTQYLAVKQRQLL